MKRTSLTLALVPLIGLTALAGCSSSGMLGAMTQADHCKAALGRIVTNRDRVEIFDATLDSKSRPGLDVVNLDLRVNGVPRAMSCSYRHGAPGGGRLAATAMNYRGKPLTKAQVALLNKLVAENDHPLDTMRKRLPNP